MDTSRKLELAQMYVDSISTDTEQNSSVRKAALGNLVSRCNLAIEEIDKRDAETIEAMGLNAPLNGSFDANPSAPPVTVDPEAVQITTDDVGTVSADDLIDDGASKKKRT